MASKTRKNFNGQMLRLNSNDSRSYLLQPELSASPSSVQFSFSPNNSFTDTNLVDTMNRNTYVSMDVSKDNSGSWQNCSAGSLAPLIPNCQPHLGGFRQQQGDRNFHSNNIYGVGDLEQVHIEGMNGRPNTKMYDYADYGHQYEELPGGRKSIAKCRMDSGIDSRSEYQSSNSGGGPEMVPEADDRTTIVNTPSDKRKRVNPLYDGMTQSMPSIYSKVKGFKDESLRRQVRCLKCALIFLIVICCAALAVSVYAVISIHNQEEDEIHPRVVQLVDDYNKMEELLNKNDTTQMLFDLIQKLQHLESNTSTQISMLHQQIAAAQVHNLRNSGDIESTHANLSDVISQLNTTIQLQLYNISKQEGPRGPQGVANFSRCVYYNVTNDAVASANYPSYTPWSPTETQLQTNTAIFAACSVEGGTGHMIQSHAIQNNMVQYRCQCSGVIDNMSRRGCHIHILSCPQNS